jgi:hypothetical protein
MHVSRSGYSLNTKVRLDGSGRQTNPDLYQNYDWREPRLHGATPMASMIKRLWNDRRGVSAWVVTIAMVPLFGMVSLGTEVGSWHVIRRHAQNAADAAAIAGATALAVNDPTGPVTAGQAFANSNGFAKGAGLCPPPPTATPRRIMDE